MNKAILDAAVVKFPAKAQPWVAAYLPVLVDLTAQQLADLAALWISGDTDTPYRTVLARMTESELAAETLAKMALAREHVTANADSVAAQKKMIEQGFILAVGAALTLV